VNAAAKSIPVFAAPRQVLRDSIPGRIELRALAPRNDGEPDAELLVYGDIGDSWYGESVTAQRIVRELQVLDATHILVRINSYGGSVSDGIAIYNALRAHSARKTTSVEGIAASIASLIAMAGDDLQIYANATLMIHAPWTIAIGNSADMRELADVLDQYAESMSTSYSRKTGKAEADVLALLTDGADHYFTARQALDDGWVDRIADLDAANDDDAEQARLAPVFDALTRYRAPAATLFAAGVQRYRLPPLAASQPSQQPAVSPAKPEAKESPMKWKALAGALGIDVSAAADDAAIRDLIARHLNLHASVNDDELMRAAIAAGRTAQPPPAATVVPIAAAADRVRGIFSAALLGHPQNERIIALRNAANVDIAAGIEPDVDLIRQQVITAMSGGEPAVPQNYAPGRLHVSGGQDARDKFIEGATRSLAARANIEQRDPQNEYNGHSLCDIAELSLRNAGVRVNGLTRDGIARRVLGAMSTSDFPQIASNVAGRALRAAYGNYPDTWRLWCAAGEVSDFKAHPRIQLGSFNNLEEIPEGAPYKFGSLSEEAESITAKTKGKAIKLTRQLIVNDDLGAFVSRAQRLGRAAGRTVNVDAYALLTSGASNNGPTMSDGGQLFNSTAQTTAGGHKYLSGSGAAPSITTIAAGRKAMREQKDKSLRETLDIIAAVILAPTGLEDSIWAILNSTADPASSNSNKANFVRDVAKLNLVTDPYLDGVSATAWYMIANPLDAPLIEIDFLYGVQTPFIDEDVEFQTDSMIMKVRMDYGLAAIDWRAGWKNPGA
jgi:ATP-dependent protease ClpP protease subunit